MNLVRNPNDIIEKIYHRSGSYTDLAKEAILFLNRTGGKEIIVIIRFDHVVKSWVLEIETFVRAEHPTNPPIIIMSNEVTRN